MRWNSTGKNNTIMVIAKGQARRHRRRGSSSCFGITRSVHFQLPSQPAAEGRRRHHDIEIDGQPREQPGGVIRNIEYVPTPFWCAAYEGEESSMLSYDPSANWCGKQKKET
jgi:hypothetical protein